MTTPPRPEPGAPTPPVRPARTASPRTARAINDRIALELLVEHGPLTAGRLKELTGLSRPSVADLLRRLADDGLVRDAGEAGESRRGPNARLYGLVADRAHVAAVDVRTGGVSFTLADLAGGAAGGAELSVADGADGTEGGDAADRGDDPVERTVTALREALRERGVTTLHTVTVGAPGMIDPATGALGRSTTLPAWHARVPATIRERLGVPVVLENEVNLAGIAEHRLGAARGRDTFVLLWLGHGVGAAVILDGALRRGASGGTGEVGFLPVPGTAGLPSATVCDGGFHSLAGAAAVCALARGHGLRPPRHTPGDGVRAAEAVVRAAVAGEGGAGAEAFLDALAERIAVGAAAVASVLDPGCVVLGGEVGRAGGRPLAERVAGRLAGMSPLATEVLCGTVEGSPVLGGGLVTALDAARRELFSPR
ncbi:ROK family transcriptional regulator [Streptomyces pini]|uniref:Sugar kinase of the NBD/HSP70 family, may contain an N-terminal HTH domain n=1 Tax=Streptomyces pini TaxID=1520580 RepID=A0A1I3ZI97_9ACTN|nr:ROK family transcriptional regulator [Streptomyces pini]SFK43762.1 Sugar kinase of the NBD/HSP70 family, may contain an N-terminal HTH domain [Streptomyces pini]